MTRSNDVDPLGPVANRLRADAPHWGPGLEAAARARLQQRLRAAPAVRARAPRTLVAVAAAILLLGAGSWWCGGQWFRASPRGPADATPVPAAAPFTVARLEVGRLESMATAPLRTELVNIVHDGRAVVRGVWRQMPPPLRRLLGS